RGAYLGSREASGPGPLEAPRGFLEAEGDLGLRGEIPIHFAHKVRLLGQPLTLLRLKLGPLPPGQPDLLMEGLRLISRLEAEEWVYIEARRGFAKATGTSLKLAHRA